MSNRYSSPLRSPMSSPASSVRPSLDIPVTNNLRSNPRRASPSPNPQPGARRNRAALRDYYNLQSAARQGARSPSRTASIASTTSTVTTATGGPQTEVLPLIDSPHFDPESYIKSLMSASSLTNILRAESTLVSEIKTLDGERKALVYDNYSKLIRATETIGMLQKGMDEQAAKGGGSRRARESVEKVAKMAHEIQGQRSGGSGGVGQRESRQQQQQQQRQRETVRWVLDAPRRFRDLADRGEGEKIIREEWEEVRDLLDAWKGVKGAEEIRKACEEVMQSLAEGEEDERQQHDDQASNSDADGND